MAKGDPLSSTIGMQPDELTPLQKEIIVVVGRYPGQFTRSSLSKLLVGAKSWKDRHYPEYRLYPGFGRKEMDYQIEILIQQSFLALDTQRCLIPLVG
jgi:hypothetical protein